VRGEAIFVARIMDFCGRDIPFFDAHFLGDKFPNFDFLVNAIESGDASSYFFAQIRTTASGYVIRADGRSYLRVKVTREDLVAMQAYPGPVYLFGVDEKLESVYVMGIDASIVRGFSAMPITHKLDCTTLAGLYDEVIEYWRQPRPAFASRFTR
jgi:hypothetical protein